MSKEFKDSLPKYGWFYILQKCNVFLFVFPVIRLVLHGKFEELDIIMIISWSIIGIAQYLYKHKIFGKMLSFFKGLNKRD